MKNIKIVKSSTSTLQPFLQLEPSLQPSSYKEDKYTDLLFNVIKNEIIENKKVISWDIWFQICGILKCNNYDKSLWLKYSNLQIKSCEKTSSSLWDGINNKSMSIYGLQNIAKKINLEGYKEWLEKWNIYSISQFQIDDPFVAGEIISLTLINTLILCKENWYMLNQHQLWKQQKEPTLYIIKELHKYLDKERNSLNKKISLAEGEEKDLLVKKLELWLKNYKNITKPSYLTVLTKCLRGLLIDDNFDEKLDNKPCFLAFQNGIMDLQTKIFREGILWDDFLTKTIPYDYKPCDKNKYDYVKSILKKILNNNNEHLEYMLRLSVTVF